MTARLRGCGYVLDFAVQRPYSSAVCFKSLFRGAWAWQSGFPRKLSCILPQVLGLLSTPLESVALLGIQPSEPSLFWRNSCSQPGRAALRATALVSSLGMEEEDHRPMLLTSCYKCNRMFRQNSVCFQGEGQGFFSQRMGGNCITISVVLSAGQG